MVVAASLVSPSQEQNEAEDENSVTNTAVTPATEHCDDEEEDDEATSDESSHPRDEEEGVPDSDTNVSDTQETQDEPSSQHTQEELHHSSPLDNDDILQHESPIMSDPNFGPNQLRRRSSVYRFQQSVRRRSRRILSRPTRSTCEMRKLLVWFTLSRLIVTPGIVVGLVVALDYANLWQGPDLAKLVVIINAALPGALIVVVLLKSQPSMAETASVVAKVYFPSYLLSIITIAAWTALGLWISLPSDDDPAVRI